MSIVWLVGVPDPWLEELHALLSGMVATRRIMSLKSLARIVAMDYQHAADKFLTVVQLDPNDSPMSIYAAMTKFINHHHASQVCCIGVASAAQKAILDGLRIACIDRPAEQASLARLLRVILNKHRSVDQTSSTNQELLRFGDVELDLPAGVLRVLATDVREAVTPKEIRILQVLAQNINDPVAREDLVRKVWPGLRVSASTVDSHMSRLRKKIDHSFECRIETAYGAGWTLSVRPHLR